MPRPENAGIKHLLVELVYEKRGGFYISDVSVAIATECLCREIERARDKSNVVFLLVTRDYNTMCRASITQVHKRR